MRIPLPAAAAFLTAAVFFGGTVMLAREQAPTGRIDKTALGLEYKPLTTWDKIRIGGAYYTDPAYVGNLNFAYGFDLKDEDLSPDDRAEIVQLIKDGSVIPASVNPVTGVASIAPPATGSGWVTGDLPGALLLSNRDTLLGRRNSTMWVTNSADVPRMTAQRDD